MKFYSAWKTNFSNGQVNIPGDNFGLTSTSGLSNFLKKTLLIIRKNMKTF